MTPRHLAAAAAYRARGAPLLNRLREPAAALALIALVGAALLAVELVNGRFRMVDFEVYHRAGARFLAGENLYRSIEDGFYEWKYGPPAALLFVPFSLLPLGAAKILWWLLLVAVFVASLHLSVRLAGPDRSVAGAGPVLWTALAMAVHVQLELHLGQVNLLVLLCFLLMALAADAGRPALFGTAFAVGLVLKPFALVVLPWLLLRRRFRLLATAALATAVALAAPLLAYRPATLAVQYAGWWGELGQELAHKSDLLAPGNHTAASLVARFSPLALVAGTPGAARLVQLGTLGAFALLVLVHVRAGRGLPRRDPAEIALLAALVPLVAFTSKNAFLFDLPAAALLLVSLPSLAPVWRGAVVAGLVLVGGNLYDLWGAALSRRLDDLSLVAMGALLLLAASTALRLGRTGARPG